MATRAKKEPSAPRSPVDWESLRTPVTEELLADITQRIVEAFHPRRVILFGSYAYGTPHIYSDVDLFVEMESDLSMFRRAAEVFRVAEVPFVPMDVLVFTPSELQARLDIGDHFYRDILERGRVLYSNVLA